MVVERLRAIAAKLSPGAIDIANAVRLTGGASMETWAFDAVGATGAVPLILRRRTTALDDHPGKKPTLKLEAEVIAAAMATGVPVPEVTYICTEADDLGEAYVMRRVTGEALGKRIATDPAFAPARMRLARQCGAALARIHAMPPVAGLATIDPGETLTGYEATWRESGAVRPTIEAAFRWLERRLPAEPVAPRLVHGDFRNGNIMVDPADGLVAVLDWELAHIGDPAEDIGWICTNSWRFGQSARRVGGFGDLDDLLAGYAEAGGAAIDRGRVDFWQMLGSLKWGVMTTMMHASFAANPAAGPERGVIGRRLSETEADIVAIIERSAK